MKSRNPAGNLSAGSFPQKLMPVPPRLYNLRANPPLFLEQSYLSRKGIEDEGPKKMPRFPRQFPSPFSSGKMMKGHLLRTLLPVIAAIILGTGTVAYMVSVHTSMDPAILTILSIVITVTLVSVSTAYIGDRLGRDVDQARKQWMTLQEAMNDNQRLLEERSAVLEEMAEERDEMKRRLLHLSDHEKERLGQELHDSLGQLLTAIGFLSRGIETRLPSEHELERESAKQIREISVEAIRQTRNVAKGLYPAHIETLGLAGAINEMCEYTHHTSHAAGISCRFSETGELPALPLGTQVHLYRVAQEAITNALKHGKAKEVSVQLMARPDFIELVVTNDGNTPEYHAGEKGIGLSIMRSRADAIGGELSVVMKENRGCEIRCRLPNPGGP